MMRFGLAISAALALGSCNSTISTEEELCRANIVGSRPDPESVKFESFEPIDRNGMIAYVSRGLMNRGLAMEDSKRAAIESVDAAATEGVVYSVLRVADTRLSKGEGEGFACAAQKGRCECFSIADG